MRQKGFAQIIFVILIIALFSVIYFIGRPNRLFDNILSTFPINNSQWKEIGDVKLPKLITKTFYLKGTTKTYDIYSAQYSSNYKSEPRVNAQVVLDVPKYTYFIQENRLKKYLKDSNEVKIIQTPTEINYNTAASSINKDLAFFNFPSQQYVPNTYLFDLNSDTFRKIDYYSKNCGSYCGYATFVSFIDPNTVLVDQADGDACWGIDKLSKMDLTTLVVTPIGSYPTGCGDYGKSAQNSFVGTYDNKLIIATFTFDNKVTYKTLKETDLTNNQDTIILDEASMPKNITGISVTKDGLVLLFNSENEGYVFNLLNKSLSLSQDLKSKLDSHTNLDDVIQSRKTETPLSNIVKVTVDNSKNPDQRGIPQGIFVTDKNDIIVELMSMYEWQGMYNKARNFNHMNDAPGICDGSATYELTDTKTDKGNFYATVTIAYDLNLTVDCKPFAMAKDNPSQLETQINLKTGKVYLKNN